jgi:hypothetical protein
VNRLSKSCAIAMVLAASVLVATIGWTPKAFAEPGAPGPAQAASSSSNAQTQQSVQEELLKRIELLERELNTLKTLVEETRRTAETAEQVATAATETAKTAQVATQEPITEQLPDTLWHLAGYMSTGLMASDAADQDSTFVGGQFNPMFHFQYKNLVMFEGEAEIEIEDDGGTNFELEYSQADILLHDSATLVLGKFLSPVGQFQERLHPAWINKFADAPAGFGHEGVQPATEVGAQLRGGVPIGDTLFTYAVGAGNGPRINAEGGVELEGFGKDDNSNKSVMGRFGFLPLPYLEVGASFLTSSVSGEHGTIEEPDSLEPSNGDFDLWGVDAAFTRGPWDIRFEYLNGDRESLATAIAHEDAEGESSEAILMASTLGALNDKSFSVMDGGGDAGAIEDTEVALLPGLSMESWYAQVAYRLSGMTDRPILKNFEPVLRYGQFNVRGLDELRDMMAEDRFDVGLNYWLAPSMVLHSSLQWRDFDAPDRKSETRFQLEFGYGF